MNTYSIPVLGWKPTGLLLGFSTFPKMTFGDNPFYLIAA
jgi:hypothetical protein